MTRKRTQYIADVRRQLVARLQDGHHRPGQRFLSNRAVASRFDISYQTANILIGELVEEGLLVRRPASGTYLPGQSVDPAGVLLIFHPRARHKNSFGAHLLDRLTARLDKERIDWRMCWRLPDASPQRRLGGSRYPIIWDRPEAIRAAIQLGHTALALNDRPPAGVGAALIDSVSVDDFSGGAYAAQFLTARGPRRPKMAILAGPTDDHRSAARVAGFLSVARGTVVTSPNWFYDGGMAVSDKVLAAGPAGIFCCNDRLAQSVLRRATDRGLPRPLVVGFDDAPVARWLHLTTVAIPWEEFVSAVIGVVRRRQSSPSSAAIAQLVSTQLVVRD
ncbi:MAG: substrate-binding domain-containing protein [Acidobacteriota bacterium]